MRNPSQSIPLLLSALNLEPQSASTSKRRGSKRVTPSAPRPAARLARIAARWIGSEGSLRKDKDLPRGARRSPQRCAATQRERRWKETTRKATGETQGLARPKPSVGQQECSTVAAGSAEDARPEPCNGVVGIAPSRRGGPTDASQPASGPSTPTASRWDSRQKGYSAQDTHQLDGNS
ncbi:hypothetical protein AXG93_3719s1450 [Marchantia polymorpha subsp. ruderalis]|uniref:Uncharacterized protein n=1 Tax=Marchantia polymorpha subsp. ruderalis TaxID=1480154 RepID=A0A176VQ29_MARPO|nr:hypothetical protein AXG93_3719s1450 [Marchantia polymorpha subsp. ruderalis]